jgi:tetratricopeptide (TPR) repeat protein
MTWLIGLTNGLTDGLRGTTKFEWALLANAELANLARAAEWGVDGGDPVDALQLVVNMGWYAFLSANMQNDEPVMLRLLEHSGELPVALRCRALMWSGLLSIGRTARRSRGLDAVDVARTAASAGTATQPVGGIDGVGLTNQAIDLARTTSDPALLLETLIIGSLHLAAVGSAQEVLRAVNDEARNLTESVGDAWQATMVVALDGLAAYVAGELERSMTTLRQAIDAFRKLGDEGTAALFEISFSEAAELRGDISGATSAMAQALAVGAEAGFRSSTILRAVLCWLAGRNGEVERAVELGREVVALAHQPFNPVIRAQALFALGVAETLAGMTDEAAEHLGEALMIHQQVGMIRETAMDHRHIGHLCQSLGDIEAATAHHRRAVELAVEVGLPWTVMLTARSMAATIVDDDPEMACRLLGNTEAVSDQFGYLPTPDERRLIDSTLATATTRIGAASVRRVSKQGAQMSYKALPGLLVGLKG